MIKLRFFLGSHVVLVLSRQQDALDQLAFPGISWPDDCAVLSPFQDQVRSVQAQFSLLPGRPMTTVAGAVQDRLNNICISKRLLNIGKGFPGKQLFG